MHEHDWLADRFEENRTRLRAIAYRMLGSPTDADDAVQEAWLRLSRADAGGIENLGGWLTTVVGRVCLDMLRARTARREDSIVGRSPSAARQLASRARRRVQGSAVPDADPGGHRAIVDAFLAASRNGDFERLLALLDPDVVLRGDAAALASGAREFTGAQAVAASFTGRARAARPAVIDGAAGAVWAPGGQPRVAFEFTIANGKIVEISLVADPDRLRLLNLTILDA